MFCYILFLFSLKILSDTFIHVPLLKFNRIGTSSYSESSQVQNISFDSPTEILIKESEKSIVFGC